MGNVYGGKDSSVVQDNSEKLYDIPMDTAGGSALVYGDGEYLRVGDGAELAAGAGAGVDNNSGNTGNNGNYNTLNVAVGVGPSGNGSANDPGTYATLNRDDNNNSLGVCLDPADDAYCGYGVRERTDSVA